MRLALDTNRYVDLMSGVREVISPIESADEILVPFVVVAELRVGFLDGSRAEDNERVLQNFLARPAIAVAYADDSTVQQYAKVYSFLRNAGKMIPTNDIWIASLCLQHGLTLYTRDRHFESLPTLARL